MSCVNGHLTAVQFSLCSSNCRLIVQTEMHLRTQVACFGCAMHDSPGSHRVQGTRTKLGPRHASEPNTLPTTYVLPFDCCTGGLALQLYHTGMYLVPRTEHPFLTGISYSNSVGIQVDTSMKHAPTLKLRPQDQVIYGASAEHKKLKEQLQSSFLGSGRYDCAVVR